MFSKPFRCRWVEDDIVDGLYQLQLNYAFDLVVNMHVEWLRLFSSQVVYREDREKTLLISLAGWLVLWRC